MFWAITVHVLFALHATHRPILLASCRRTPFSHQPISALHPPTLLTQTSDAYLKENFDKQQACWAQMEALEKQLVALGDDRCWGGGREHTIA